MLGKRADLPDDLNQIAKAAFGSRNVPAGTQTVGARLKVSFDAVSSRNEGVGHRTSLGELQGWNPAELSNALSVVVRFLCCFIPLTSHSS